MISSPVGQSFSAAEAPKYEVPTNDGPMPTVGGDRLDPQRYIGYIFLDVVAFTRKFKTNLTRNRCIDQLNELIVHSVADMTGKEHVWFEVIYIPTGDGVCICLSGIPEFCDTHIRIAESILERVSAQTKFEVRIGVNNDSRYRKDSVVRDINGKTNFLGEGINNCARIMDFAAPNQLTIGENTAEWLVRASRTNLHDKDFDIRYIGRLIRYLAIDKHGQQMTFFTRNTIDPPRSVRAVEAVSNVYQYAISNLNFPTSPEPMDGVNDATDFFAYLHDHSLPVEFPLWCLELLFRGLQLRPPKRRPPNPPARSTGKITSAPLRDFISDALREMARTASERYEPILMTFCLLACCSFSVDIDSEFPELIERLRYRPGDRDLDQTKHIILNQSLWAASYIIAAKNSQDAEQRRSYISRASGIYWQLIPRFLEASPIDPIDDFFSPILIFLSARFDDWRTLYRSVAILHKFCDDGHDRNRSFLSDLHFRYTTFMSNLIWSSPSSLGFCKFDVQSSPIFAAFWQRVLEDFTQDMARRILRAQDPSVQPLLSEQELSVRQLINRLSLWRNAALLSWN